MTPSFFKNLGPISLEKIKKYVSCETSNIASGEKFSNFVGLNDVKSGYLTFFYDNEKTEGIKLENATVICTSKGAKKLKPSQKLIIVKNVQMTVAKISNVFFRDFNDNEVGNFAKYKIGDSCNISNNSSIQNGVIIGNNVTIEDGVHIKCNCIIGDNSSIGANTVISNSILGENVSIGRNASIGQKGFGFFINNADNINIYHCGSVILKSNVAIGSGCTIDRGSFSDTVIGENTYLDNLCHVAHNVKIGNNSIFAAMTGIAGSAIVGNNVLTGGQVGIAGHIKIGNNVQIAAKSGVFSDIEDGKKVMGNPAIGKLNYIKKYKRIYGN